MSCPSRASACRTRWTHDVLLKSGAGIYEVNAVRRHISQTNGGMLAKRIATVGAELIASGSPTPSARRPPGTWHPYAQYKSTPFGPDQTTLDDARP